MISRAFSSRPIIVWQFFHFTEYSPMTDVISLRRGKKRGVVHATTPEKKMKRFSLLLSAFAAKDHQLFFAQEAEPPPCRPRAAAMPRGLTVAGRKKGSVPSPLGTFALCRCIGCVYSFVRSVCAVTWEASSSGTAIKNLLPTFRTLLIFIRPPSSWTRSRILSSPNPRASLSPCGSNPRP